jgi:tetratricopeptide (TPR) repeat protein
MVLGVHGFYLRLAAMAMPNALSYPIATHGPSGLDVALGAIGLVAIAAVAALRRFPGDLRASAMLWLFGWLPASHLVLPLQMIVVADRYALIPTLGVALAIAVGCARISRVQLRAVVVAAIALAGALRTLDAQSNWSSTEALWARAVESNPDDGEAWSFWAEALDEAGDHALAEQVVDEGLQHVDSRRLLLRKALLLVNSGHRGEALPLFLRAAQAGEPKAMSNLALLELADSEAKPALLDDALAWARRGAAAAPTSAHAHRTHGKVALAAQHPDEALAAFTSAYELEPQNLGNRFNLALALLALHRPADAIPHLEACAAEPGLAGRAAAALDDARRQLR